MQTRPWSMLGRVATILRRVLSPSEHTTTSLNYDSGEAGKTMEDDELEEVARDQFSDLPDGCGCAEVWEHLSEVDEQRTGRVGAGSND